jgi:hypothetical protein
MSVEVPPHVEEIFGAYPELVEQWKAEMGKPCMQEWNYEGSVKRILDPMYLRRVAFEHRRLIEGNIERPNQSSQQRSRLRCGYTPACGNSDRKT